MIQWQPSRQTSQQPAWSQTPLAFPMSTSICHTVASGDQEEGTAVAMLRSQLRADCSLWGSVDSYSSGQTSGPGFLLSLSSSVSCGVEQPGAYLFLILRGQASTSPLHHVYLHQCPDGPQACAEAGYLQVPSVFIICPRRKDNRASPNPWGKKPP